MNDFAALLADLETLQKASGPDDKKPVAEDPDDKGDDKKIEAAADNGKKQGEVDEKETFGKAFKVKLEDGSEAEAFDGTAMLKALHAEHEGLRSAVESREEDILKAFDMAVGTIRDLQSKVAEQDTLIKALKNKVDTIGAAGVGRRTMLTIAEKLSPSAGVTGGQPGGGQSGSEGPSAKQVMMKAQFMARKGELDWGALPRIEAHQARGSIAPEDLLARFPELLTPVN